MKSLWYGAALLASTSLLFDDAAAQSRYDLGANDKEIRIGNTAPYSGPASPFSAGAKTMSAYFRMVNNRGGVNGRKITFLSYDDGFSPPKTVEQTRRLVEQDEVFVIAGSVGTATNSATQKYLNIKKVPQVFPSSGASKWNDPKQFPWTIGWQPDYQSEGRVYAKYLTKEHPGKKIGVLYQNDDYGKDLLKGLKAGLAGSAMLIVSEQSYDLSDPTIDSQIVKLKSANPDILISMTTPKFGAQGIKKVGELAWKPVHIIGFISSSIAATIRPAGYDHAQGILSSTFIKDVSDPRWKDDQSVKDFTSLMNEFYPEGDKTDATAFYSYGVAQALVLVLQRCGDNLTHENFLRQAEGLKDVEIDVLLPGIKVNTSATRHQPIDQLQMQRFTGDRWELFGQVFEGDAGR